MRRDWDAQQGFYANKDSSACIIEKRKESSQPQRADRYTVLSKAFLLLTRTYSYERQEPHHESRRSRHR